jgi:CFEM domain
MQLICPDFWVMKLVLILNTFCLLAPALLVSAQSQNETFIAKEFSKIPACAVSLASPKLTRIPVKHSSSSQLECLSYTIPTVGCTLANTTCLCASQELITITAKCVLANCTIVEGVGECRRSNENSHLFDFSRTGQSTSSNLWTSIPISQSVNQDYDDSMLDCYLYSSACKASHTPLPAPEIWPGWLVYHSCSGNICPPSTRDSGW